MVRLSRTGGFIFFILISFLSKAQDAAAVTFQFDRQPAANNEVFVTITGRVNPGYKLYALQKSDSDALYSSVVFDSTAKKYLKGAIEEKGNKKTETDATLNAQVSYFTDSVIWRQKVNARDSAIIKGVVNYMYKKGDEYIPAEESFRVFVSPSPKNSGSISSVTNTVENKSLLWIFLTAFAGGLIALITPCVYSMIPVTVSFFTKRSRTRTEGIKNALYYSSSIVFIFTLLGFLITLIFGPAALNNLATNWIANLIFFAIFLIFGISFLGAFEIVLPAAWANKADSKAGLSSFLGIFFMALTLVVVSFSCTGPIIGNLLVLAAKGSYWGPLVGMFGFSLAMALPFALFAFFPSKINMLGRAGGWLNAVKVTLGFLELALALKFLSNADLSKGWRILDREIFISLWVVIFILLGFYLLGKLKFSHDDDLPKNDFGIPYLSVTRLFFAITALAFAVYMIPGLWGAPLRGISAFVPPMGTQDFNSSSARNSSAVHSSLDSADNKLPHPQKYYEQMKVNEPEVVTTYGLVTYFDYDEALQVARKLKRPLMLDFTGINCVNCRKMEGQVWSNAEVMKRLKEDFVIVSLYVDVHNIDLPENEIYFSKALNAKVQTLGDKNADMQVTRFGANTQPYYFFLDENEERLIPEGYGYDPNIKKFIDLLDTAKKEYNNK